MKKILQFLLAISITLFFMACEKNDSSSTSGITMTVVKNTATSSTWRVSTYSEAGIDKTQIFNGFSFIFASSNVLTATKSSTIITGNWSVGTDDSKVKLSIGFGSPSAFTELSEDWEVTAVSDARISLQHTSGGNMQIDQLVFEKN